MFGNISFFKFLQKNYLIYASFNFFQSFKNFVKKRNYQN